MKEQTPKTLNEQLHDAVFESDYKKVQALLAQGADVNAPMRPDFPKRPIATCLTSNRGKPFEDMLKTAKILMEAGADPHFPDPMDKKNVITGALVTQGSGWLRFLRVILTYGPHKGNPNRCDGNGELPLQSVRDKEALELLLEYGAKPFKPNASGETPLETFAASPLYLKLMMKASVLKSLYGADGKIELRQLLDESGQPTAAMRLMMSHAIPDELGNPDTYRNGIFDMGEMIPHLPQEMWQKVDFSPYRRRETETPGEGQHVKRYRRPKPDDIER